VSFPSFYQPSDVTRLYIERAAVVAEEARRYRDEHRIADAAADHRRIAGFGIDCQVAFCHPDASLFVPGAVEDTTRTVEWLYRNLGRITRLYFTLDTHSVFQIFHPAAWVDREGRHPAPFTVITAEDVRQGRWIPRLDGAAEDARAVCLEYCEKLEATGRYVLTIWPYHALLGGVSHTLVPALMEASLFHSVARRIDEVFEIKGRLALTENYSVFAPEVRELQGRPLAGFNPRLFDELLSYDRIYVFGQAKSHCVMESLRDIQRECVARGRERLLEKVYILEDAMSPVTPPPLDPLPEALDFPRVAERAIRDFAASGMKVARTADPMD
jgi:nicotinamidase-related amidase